MVDVKHDQTSGGQPRLKWHLLPPWDKIVPAGHQTSISMSRECQKNVFH